MKNSIEIKDDVLGFAVRSAVFRIIDSHDKNYSNLSGLEMKRDALQDVINQLSGVGWVAVSNRELLDFVNSYEDIYGKHLESINLMILSELDRLCNDLDRD